MRIKPTLLLGILLFTVLYTGNAAPSDASEFSVYPNPIISNELSIDAELDFNKVEILNIVGQVVYSKELEPSSNIRLNIDLQSGMYLLRVSYTNQTNNTKRIWVN